MNNENTYLSPLTKDMKNSINDELDNRIAELNKCDNTSYVNLYKSLYGLAKTIVNALPDGYPVPVSKK